MATDNNAMVLVCGKCGEKNRLPCGHCRKCGAKLDFGAAEEKILQEARSGKRGASGWRTALLLLFAAVLGLSLWPSGIGDRDVGGELDAKRWEMKRALLLDALDRGFPAAQTVTEAELNAWLAKLPGMQESKGGMAAQLVDTGVVFGENRAQWLVLVRRGALRFSVVYEAKAQGSELVLTGAKLGHLPLPGPLGRLYAKTQAKLFRPFAREARILDHLDSLVLRDGEIELLLRAQ
ncbi:MAG: hypothetical protein IKQ55_05010 [Kiritimatiellae bacterium]|jgi:hypothetical protein|nr:hypothetical protein [Kiritimatiellia bacterium]